MNNFLRTNGGLPHSLPLLSTAIYRLLWCAAGILLVAMLSRSRIKELLPGAAYVNGIREQPEKEHTGHNKAYNTRIRQQKARRTFSLPFKKQPLIKFS